MLALRSFELKSQRFLQRAAQFGKRGKARLFVHPRERIARIRGKEERNVLGTRERRLMQQNAFEKLGEACGESFRAS